MQKPKHPAMRWAIALFVVCALLRIAVAAHQGIWVDEVFSLAMATGHSLEHPADQADVAQRDYVEPRDEATPDEFRKFLRHDAPPASPARVVRAVFRSDTSPPLYYLLLYLWTLAFGTSDLTLRMFSVTAALACFPLMWWLGRRIGGTRTALAACALFTFSPASIYYGTEGRMYSLLWFFTLCSMASTLQLWRRGSTLGVLVLWILAAAGGLLTHYFFAFVLLALGGWLIISPGRASRLRIVVASIVVALLVAPWFVQIPATMAHWRVTGYWLNVAPEHFRRLKGIILLPWSYFTATGVWGIRPIVAKFNAVLIAILALLAILSLRQRLFTPKRLMLWSCIIAACAGLVVFDLWRKTYVVDCPRYALAGFPAALLLAGFALARLAKIPRFALLTLIVLTWLVVDRRIIRSDFRVYPIQQAASAIAEKAGPDDVVIISSIPSGVSGLARYLPPAPANEPMLVSWVGQLKQRSVPDDLLRVAHGRKRIILVRMHEVWWPADHEDWLSQHAKLSDQSKIGDIQIETFEPRDAERF